jgi:hypothetical protein
LSEFDLPFVSALEREKERKADLEEIISGLSFPKRKGMRRNLWSAVRF